MSKTIDGVVLSDFVELLLGRADHVHCPEYIAKKLEHADTDKIFIHVEYPNKENALKQLRVWRVNAWRTSYKKWQQDKELSARDRQVHVIASELRAIAVRKFCGMTGLKEEEALKAASAIIQSRNESVCRQLFGMEIADLVKADVALTEYKTKIGAK